MYINIQFLLMASLLVIVDAWEAFILPLIIGPILLIKFRKDELSRALGWLTLKPIAATFLLAWYLAIATRRESGNPYFTLLPGIILTLMITIKFRSLLKTQTLLFVFFLVLDAIRWLNTFLMLSPWVQPSFGSVDNPQGPLYVFAMILPNVYSLIAISSVLLRTRKVPAPL